MRKLLCLVAGIVSVTYFSKGRGHKEDTGGGIEDDQMLVLQKQLARVLKAKSYHALDPVRFEEALTDLKLSPQTLKTRLAGERVICTTCRLLVHNIQTGVVPLDQVVSTFCNLYITFQTWTISDFCHQIIKINKPILDYVIRGSSILSPEYACAVLLQNENCYVEHPALLWRTKVPEGPPKVPRVPPSPPKRPIKILHVSDFHVTHDYEVGGVADCGYPVCCKRGLGNRLRGANAGVWGHYNCDVPPWMFAHALTHISDVHKDIDAIYFTGDVIDHSVWKASSMENSKQIAYVYQKLASSFPNTPVLPVLGNHEAAPLNVFAPPNVTRAEFSQSWLYGLSDRLWSRWLGDSSKTISRQGYYSVMANDKLKIVGLNNNVCYIYNWWLLYDTTFLVEQLDFLRDELLDAEDKGQFVHILGHVFPGERECVEPWEASYNALVARFSHVIKGQFFGHTHTDAFKIFYDEGRPVSVAYNGGSLTPYTNYNPNYKIVTVDGHNYDVVDIDTYYFNVTQANLHPNITPRWRKLYSTREAYGLPALSPAYFDALARKMSENDALFDKYWRFYVREGDVSIAQGCDRDCRQILLDSITRTVSLTAA
ncbi:sphingomyelin phosphodiesterase-like isoform X2 [Cylas formicarius]|uniref:sphingomyelin phosphodiesterase-like isoform X2 n=1 Tax=Cylas formicarius TaxID=197179 RepID=UPI0029586695|nr:sphingomyelin phosphodiesterase-like isoform X2 [Cylas formicarius]